MLRSYKGQIPRIAPSAYIDPQAVVLGDVEIGEDSSVWPCAVIRGDVHYIRIGGDTGKPVASLGEDAPGGKSVYAVARNVIARLEAVNASAGAPVVQIL